MTNTQNRIDQAWAEFEVAKANSKIVNTEEARQRVSKAYDVWYDIKNEPKRAEAKAKAAAAWARWVIANDKAKKAFIGWRKIYSESGDHGPYKKYEQAWECRDSEYKDATEADEEVWRLESLTEEEI